MPFGVIKKKDFPNEVWIQPKKSKARKYRRGRLRRRRLSYLPVGGYPDRFLCRLRYVETNSYNAGVGSFSENIFRANGIFDPNYTGGGHQPSNRDSWAARYDRYTVLSSKITVTWVPTTSTPLAIPSTVVVCLSEAGTNVTTAHGAGGIDNVLEQPRLNRSIGYVGDPSRPMSLTRKFSAKRFFGTKNILGDTPYSADVDANPAEQAFWEVASISPDDTVDPSAMTLRTTIEYIVMFTEPRVADAS